MHVQVTCQNLRATCCISSYSHHPHWHSIIYDANQLPPKYRAEGEDRREGSIRKGIGIGCFFRHCRSIAHCELWRGKAAWRRFDINNLDLHILVWRKIHILVGKVSQTFSKGRGSLLLSCYCSGQWTPCYGCRRTQTFADDLLWFKRNIWWGNYL